MTFNPYQQDAYDVAHDYVSEVMPAVTGPLADLPDQEAAVLNAADPRHTYVPGPQGSVLAYPRGRQPSVGWDVAKGAAAGLAGWLVWRQMRRRRAAKGEFTSPGFRAIGLLVVPLLVAFVPSMVWPQDGGRFFGSAFVVGAVSFLAYLAYRATGHGRYNTRRRGSPWRDDHRRR